MELIKVKIMKIGGAELILKTGDITEQDTDAIVNAANAMLKLGGGVAGAIRKKGGPEIQADCDRHGPTTTGSAVLTTGGNLKKAKHVIHAVGPMMGEGNEERKLRDAITNSLKLADAHNLASISFPAISTGIFGYPIVQASAVMLAATIEYLNGNTGLQKVVFVLFSDSDYNVFEKALENICSNE